MQTDALILENKAQIIIKMSLVCSHITSQEMETTQETRGQNNFAIIIIIILTQRHLWIRSSRSRSSCHTKTAHWKIEVQSLVSIIKRSLRQVNQELVSLEAKNLRITPQHLPQERFRLHQLRLLALIELQKYLKGIINKHISNSIITYILEQQLLCQIRNIIATN